MGERIMRSQAFSDPGRAQYMNSAKTMEINPRHPIVAELNRHVEENAKSQELADTAWLLYDTALLQSGFLQDDVDAFASRMFRTMKSALNLDSLDLEEEIDVPDDDEEEEEDLEDDFEDASDEL